jgi:hypothetical protein
MSALAPLLESFFTERLIGQRQASQHTVAAYRDAFCLLLYFAQRRTGHTPHHQLPLEDLDAALIGPYELQVDFSDVSTWTALRSGESVLLPGDPVLEPMADLVVRPECRRPRRSICSSMTTATGVLPEALLAHRHPAVVSAAEVAHEHP